MSVWTIERLDTLKQLWSTGHLASVIAGRLGSEFTRNSVLGKVHRLGLEARRDDPAPRHQTRSAAIESAPRRPSRPAALAKLPKLRERPPVPVVPVEVIEPPTGEGVTIHALDAEMRLCRWIVQSDPLGRGGDLYCGTRNVVGHSWCAWHKSLAYSKAPRPEVASSSPGRMPDRLSTARLTGAATW